MLLCLCGHVLSILSTFVCYCTCLFLVILSAHGNLMSLWDCLCLFLVVICLILWSLFDILVVSGHPVSPFNCFSTVCGHFVSIFDNFSAFEAFFVCIFWSLCHFF